MFKSGDDTFLTKIEIASNTGSFNRVEIKRQEGGFEGGHSSGFSGVSSYETEPAGAGGGVTVTITVE